MDDVVFPWIFQLNIVDTYLGLHTCYLLYTRTYWVESAVRLLEASKRTLFLKSIHHHELSFVETLSNSDGTWCRILGPAENRDKATWSTEYLRCSATCLRRYEKLLHYVEKGRCRANRHRNRVWGAWIMEQQERKCCNQCSLGDEDLLHTAAPNRSRGTSRSDSGLPQVDLHTTRSVDFTKGKKGESYVTLWLAAAPAKLISTLFPARGRLHSQECGVWYHTRPNLSA